METVVGRTRTEPCASAQCTICDFRFAPFWTKKIGVHRQWVLNSKWFIWYFQPILSKKKLWETVRKHVFLPLFVFPFKALSLPKHLKLRSYPHVSYIIFHDFLSQSHCAWVVWFCMTIFYNFAWFDIFLCAFFYCIILHDHFSQFCIFLHIHNNIFPTIQL